MASTINITVDEMRQVFAECVRVVTLPYGEQAPSKKLCWDAAATVSILFIHNYTLFMQDDLLERFPVAEESG